MNECNEQKMQEQDVEKFGCKIIPKNKLTLCRASDYSKYTGDLLELCFGRKVLAESVLKAPTNRSAKTNVLDHEVINDILSHVCDNTVYQLKLLELP